MPGRGESDILWRAAGKLRGSVDASLYKDFVLGLVFLKYVSDSAGDGPFRVPEGARWTELAAGTGSGTIGTRIDAAMGAVMRANPPLAGVLPRIFGRTEVDQRRLGELVELIGDAHFDGGRDVLGEVYEYFLEKFARAEGKRGGEFYTPPSVVKLLVEILEPFKGRVYDPCCGSGGMFVQAERFVLNHRGRRDDIAVHGQEANERTWRLAKMNLAVHGIAGDLSDRCADTFYEDAHPGLQADYIMANPPFNMSDWDRDAHDHVLFIDARAMGTLVDRTERVLTEGDITRIAAAYRSWHDGTHSDVPGFCYSAPLDEIRSHDHVLTPGRYVGTAAPRTDDEPVTDEVERLTKELFAQFEESAHLDQIVRTELERLHE